MKINTYKLIHPPLVEAVQLSEENISDVRNWCLGQIIDRIRLTVYVAQGERTRTAHIGWYVIKNWAGDFSVMSPDDFQAKYERHF